MLKRTAGRGRPTESLGGLGPAAFFRRHLHPREQGYQLAAPKPRRGGGEFVSIFSHGLMMRVLSEDVRCLLIDLSTFGDDRQLSQGYMKLNVASANVFYLRFLRHIQGNIGLLLIQSCGKHFTYFPKCQDQAGLRIGSI